ncbi:hypothetical protein EYF80_015594 [Liparis tanakae]|uniref:Uncharacterized protein n=1 Tax=Liparis tanakae TaxID=230148 RepID=A0A4Z2I7W6_9TELE|nr:hypothetical protein EYF80_015594 [Liparis tanakae]
MIVEQRKKKKCMRAANARYVETTVRCPTELLLHVENKDKDQDDEDQDDEDQDGEEDGDGDGADM